MLLFMEKPSKKLYPEYYNVIERPIDMLTIEANIKVRVGNVIILSWVRSLIKT